MYLRVRVLMLGLAVAVVTGGFSPSSHAAEPGAKKIPTLLRTEYDPDAERVGLFAGMENGSLESWLIPQDEHFGYVFVENKADKPLTVELPRSIVAVQNLKQFQQPGGNIFGGPNQNGNQSNQGSNGSQSVGGGMQGSGQNQQNNGFQFFGNNNRAGNGNGNNGFFFSIPPQTRVRLDFHSVCLNYGLKTPSQRQRYSLLETEKYTNDENLQELLALVGSGQIDPDVSQAVAWHLTDGLSYEQLASLKQYQLGGYETSIFKAEDLQLAVKLFDYVKVQLAERKKAEKHESAVAESQLSSSQK